MRRVRTKFVFLLIFTVMASSFLATMLSALISRILYANGVSAPFFLGYALKEILTPVCTVLITIMISAVISKRAVLPVIELSKATKQIASGNFDVSISGTGSKDEFGQLARDFVVMAQALKTNEYLAKDFVTNVSHEFRTPLAIISGYAKLINSDEITKAERHDYTLKIQSETERLIKLASNILRLSKLDNQKIQERPVRFSLDEQIRQAVLDLESEWSTKGIRLDIDIPEIIYLGNEALLAQVWSNLLENAVKFTGENGTIGVNAHFGGNKVIVEISDDGMGMDAATKERIFERFFQGDSSHSGQGNGLGLALVKQILDVLGGSVSVNSEPGVGSVFTVAIPINHAVN